MDKYSAGELEIFNEMMERIVQSKGAEIFKMVQENQEDPHGMPESDFDEPAEEDEEEEESEDEDEHLEGDSPRPRKAKVAPLKPSGVIIKMEVDPDQSDEDVQPLGQRRPSKRESMFDPSAATADQVKKRLEEKLRDEVRARKAKENQRLLKDINKNFNRKDKRDTTRFLVRHGLSPEEAKQYIQLGSAFDVKNLDPKQKSYLSENFQAQVFAFRKLRERLLLNDNQADIYN